MLLAAFGLLFEALGHLAMLLAACGLLFKALGLRAVLRVALLAVLRVALLAVLGLVAVLRVIVAVLRVTPTCCCGALQV